MTSDNFELLPDSGQPSDHRCCQHAYNIFTTHPCLYGFMFISILTLDIAEVINDAFLLKDISYLEQGLVYGPLNPSLVMMLLLMSAVGTLAILFEIINILRDVCSGTPWVDLDLVSALVIWLEEISTISVNLVISLCHSEPISYFQLSKALIVTISVLVRLVVPLIRSYLTKESKELVKNPFRKSVYRFVATIGLCLALCGSVSIFTFTHVIAIDEQQFQFRLPQEIWAGKLAFEKYFDNVGIYFNHRHLKKSKDEEVWVKIADVEEFYDNNGINVKFSYTLRGDNVIDKLVVNSYNMTNERYRECYTLTVDKNNSFQYVTDTPCNTNYIRGITEKMIFKFNFIRPQSTLILGDIAYNAIHMRNSICYNTTANSTDIFDTLGNHPVLLGKLLYMKQETRLQTSYRLVQRNRLTNQTSTKLLYDADHFILSADDIWSTGMYGCECTGKHGPTKDDSIPLSC